VGAILVAAATSLPELSTDLYAVRQGTPSLAVGDLFGSSMANMLILAIADIATHRVRVLTRVAINQALVGGLAIVLTAAAAAGTLTGFELTVAGMGAAGDSTRLRSGNARLARQSVATAL
jgi:cation:H+ antiporter